MYLRRFKPPISLSVIYKKARINSFCARPKLFTAIFESSLPLRHTRFVSRSSLMSKLMLFDWPITLRKSIWKTNEQDIFRAHIPKLPTNVSHIFWPSCQERFANISSGQITFYQKIQKSTESLVTSPRMIPRREVSTDVFFSRLIKVPKKVFSG